MYCDNYFILRVPRCSFDNFFLFNHASGGKNDSETIDNLKKHYSKPKIKEALFVASPSLYKSLERWLNNDFFSEKDKEKLDIAFLKYFLRIIYRPTPFGLFSSLAVGSIDDNNTNLKIQTSKYKKHISLDSEFFYKFLQEIYLQNKNKFRYFSNNTSYKLGDELRYISYEINGGKRQLEFCSINSNEYILRALEIAKNGAYKDEIINIFTNEGSKSELEEFVDNMIDNNLLICELEPQATGKEYIEHMLDVLNERKIDSKDKANLDLIKKNLTVLNSDNSVHYLHDQDEFVDFLEKFKINSKYVFKVNQKNDTKNLSIKKSCIDLILEDISYIINILPRNTYPDLETFKKEFIKRFENKEISLLEALDSETGIGYPINVDNDVPYILNDTDYFYNKKEYNSIINSSEWELFLNKKYIECLNKKSNVINLRKSELITFYKENNDIPSSNGLMGTIYAKNVESLEKNDFTFFFNSFSGSTVNRLCGRFGHSFNEIKSLLKRECDFEEGQSNNAILAEISFISQYRLVNVIQRPLVRKYEIPIIDSSNSESRIPLNDLFISIDKDNSIKLYSKSLKKRVIPKMSNAHNYNLESNAIYRFLCDLKNQEDHTWSFRWGNLMKNYKYIPRLCFGRLILSKSRWILEENDIKDIYKISDNDELIKKFSILRKKFNIPEVAVLVEGDRRIILNFNNSYCLKILIKTVKKYISVQLEEELNDDFLLKDEKDKNYNHEIIIPIKNLNSIKSNSDFHETSPIKNKIHDTFMIGSEWIFFKIYCGRHTADFLLTNLIKPLSDDLLNERIIDKWFFIRYFDSEDGFHLRVRFHGIDDFYKIVIERFYKEIEKYLMYISSIKIDTYKREIDRYGFDKIPLSEDLFFFDSVTVIKLIEKILNNPRAEEIRWWIAIKGTDILLDEWSPSLKEKKILLKNLNAGLMSEFKIENNKRIKKKINSKYRNERKLLASILEEDENFQEVSPIFSYRSKRSRKIIHNILNSLDAENEHSKFKLIGSHLHMYLNRLFINHSRAQEMIVYDFLYKFYNTKSHL